MVEVEILGQAITAQYGTLNTGDILRTDAEFARHLVEDCKAAKYRGKAAPVDVATPEVEQAQAAEPKAQAEAPRSGRKSKQ